MSVPESSDRLLRIAMFATRIRETHERNHLLRLRIAFQIQRLADAFIRDEIQTAQSKSQSDPAYLSWTEIGKILEISRAAAHARYGKRRNSADSADA